MTRIQRIFLLVEGTSFAVAGFIHSGLLGMGGDKAASIAESTLAVVVLLGLMLTWVSPARVRLIALVAQTIALLGTLVGAFTIAIGIGPRTLADIVFHVTMLAVLACGLVVSARGDQPNGRERHTAAARLLGEGDNSCALP